MLTVSSCTVSSLQASPNISLIIPAPLVIGARVFQIFYGSFQVDFGLLLNVLILILVFRFKKLRTVSSGIVVQIAIANLILAISNGIYKVVNKPACDLILGLVLCITSGCAIYIFLTIRTLLVCFFSFDRFASVFAPFVYPRHSHRITILMCVLAWSISVAIFLMTISPILDCYSYANPTLSCVVSPRYNDNCSILFYTHMAIIIFAVITSVVFFYSSIHQRKKDSMQRI